MSESKQANGITAKSTIWPDDETMEIFRSLAARIALKDAHIAGLNEEIKIQAARIAELEAQNAEGAIPEGELGRGRQYLAWIPDDDEYRALTYWPDNPDEPLWCGATSYQLSEATILQKLTPPTPERPNH